MLEEDYVNILNNFIRDLKSRYEFEDSVIDGMRELSLKCYDPNTSVNVMIDKFQQEMMFKYIVFDDILNDFISIYKRNAKNFYSLHHQIENNNDQYEDSTNSATDSSVDDEDSYNQSLSIKELNQNKLLVTTKETECSICTENIEVNTIQRILKCNHTFHYQCIDAWLERESSCPLCRHNLTSKCK